MTSGCGRLSREGTLIAEGAAGSGVEALQRVHRGRVVVDVDRDEADRPGVVAVQESRHGLAHVAQHEHRAPEFALEAFDRHAELARRPDEPHVPRVAWRRHAASSVEAVEVDLHALFPLDGVDDALQTLEPVAAPDAHLDHGDLGDAQRLGLAGRLEHPVPVVRSVEGVVVRLLPERRGGVHEHVFPQTRGLGDAAQQPLENVLRSVFERVSGQPRIVSGARSSRRGRGALRSPPSACAIERPTTRPNLLARARRGLEIREIKCRGVGVDNPGRFGDRRESRTPVPGAARGKRARRIAPRK